MILDFFFPPLCLHCHAKTKNRFCKGCAASFELIDVSNRCPYCFCEIGAKRPCLSCSTHRFFGLKIAAALDGLPPVRTMIRELGHGHNYLAKTASAFMLAQFCHLNWPQPDLIIPLTFSLWGKDSSYWLAKNLGKSLDCPVKRVLKQKLGERDFVLRKELCDQNILIVTDYIKTAENLRRAAALFSTSRVRALSFARSLE